MTAIAGLWRLDGRPDAGEACRRMLRPLAMYGGDGEGRWDGGAVALGRTLRRLLPEDVHDRQPLQGEAGLTLVADVRLDNRDELGQALGIVGERLRVMADADVLLAACERWGLDAFDRLVGDYACAVWDSGCRRLVLARDPTGRRPLYYHRAGQLFAFASMPKGLHALPEVPYAADEERVAEWLRSAGGGAPFQGLEALGAGCLLVATPDRVEVRRHWNPQRNSVRLASPQDYVEGLRELLDEAVACRLRGAADVATHLSAGLDSAAVTATAARLLSTSGGRVVAFTAVPRAGYDGAALPGRLMDEGPLAAATAVTYANIEHVLIRAGGRSPLASLDRNFRLHEQPLTNLCNGVWIDAINDAARERGLRVLLNGAMGNIGFSYAGLERLPELAGAGRLLECLAEARAMVSRGRRLRGVLATTLAPWVPAPAWRLIRRLSGAAMPAAHRRTMLRPALAKPASSARPARDGFDMRMSVLQGAGAVTQKGMLAEWGVDVRDPTADKRLLEFCLGAPMDQFLRDGQTRSLARRAVADRVPASVLDSPLTGYQGADWHEGLGDDLAGLAAEVARLEACASADQLLDTARLRQLVDDWPRQGWERPQVREDYRLALLQALSAGHFLRRVAGGNG